MPYLMVNNSASIGVMLIVWWSVFFSGLLKEWIWEIEQAILFLILISEMIITILESNIIQE